MVTLKQYLQDAEITQEAFASEIGATQATVSRLCKSKSQPSKSLMLAIEKATDGKVPVLSWFSEAAQ